MFLFLIPGQYNFLSSSTLYFNISFILLLSVIGARNILIIYFSLSRDYFAFLLRKSYGHNLKYVVTRGTKTRPHSCLRMRSNYPQTLMKLTLYHSDKRIFRRRARPCVDSNSINRTSSIVYIKAVNTD